MAVINGTADDDLLLGTQDDDTILGLGGNDTILGGDGVNPLTGNDTIDGGDGNDLIGAGDGDNLVFGGEGDDTIGAGDGADTIDGGAGDDVIGGGGGDDVIAGGAGSDQIGGGAGNDVIDGGDGDDLLGGDEGDDSISGGAGADRISGGDGDDVVDGGDGDDAIAGDAGADTLLGGLGNDSIDGGSGDDVIDGGDGDDALVGGDGNDSISGGEGNDSILGEAGDDTLLGGGGQDVIDGGIGADSIDGGDGDDTLLGGDDNDVVDGGDGNDAILGGAGDDTLRGGAGVDFIDGEAGDDIIEGGEGNDLLLGGEGDDSIDGGEGDDTIEGGAGNDTLLGGLGDDSIEGGDGADSLAGGDGDDTLLGGAGDDVVDGGAGADSIDGGDGNDTLSGGDGDDAIDGGLGDDLLEGGAGDDTLTGGGGNDTASYATAPTGVTVDLGTGQVDDGFGGTDTLVGIANVDGSDFGDTIVGDGAANRLDGRAGDDRLEGGDGADTLIGGEGEDTLLGGEGDDSLEGGAGADSLNGGAGADLLDGGTGNDTLLGGDGDDTLLGGDGDDSLVGGDGDDSIVGGAGNDTIVPGAGDDTVDGGAGDDSVIGGDDADVFFGGEGDDTLSGAGGADELHGEAGDDLLLGGDGADSLFGGDGDDRLEGGSGADSLEGGDGNDTLLGEDGDDSLEGGDGDDSLSGGAANDFIDGGAGDDTIDGGDGNDVLFGRDGNDVIDGGAGVDEIHGGDGDDTIRGGAGADNLYGGDGNDFIDGGDGNDNIDGGFGRNVMRGGPGDDTFQGARRGDFTLDLNLVDYSDALGPITVIFSAQQSVTGDPSIGNDRLNGIDGIIGTDFADRFTVDDLFYGQHEKYNEFEGRGGNDRIFGNGETLVSYASAGAAVTVDIRAGTASGDASVGDDRFEGVNGVRGSAFDDRLFGSDNGEDDPDELFEGLAGNDTIDGRGGIDIASYLFSPAGIDIDLGTGVAADGFGTFDTLINIETILGSAFADRIRGNGADNHFRGAGGDDILYGGGGNDTLDGGDGIDSAVYDNSLSGISIDLANGSGFDGLGGLDTLISIENIVGSAFGDTIIGDGEANLLDGGGGNDLLRGGGGDDTLLGGAGRDTLFGERGDDVLIGGAGNDVLDGGAGDDVLEGGLGNDVLRGGLGLDTLTGGPGADRFEGTARELDGDRITDFQAGDTIRVNQAIFTTAEIQLVPFPAAQTTEIRIDTARDGSFATRITVDGILRGLFEATPGAGFTDIRLLQENRAPVVVAPVAAQAIDEGSDSTLSVAAVFSDPDGDPLTLSAELASGAALPSWITFDPDTATFSFDSPEDGDVGFYQVRVTANDNPDSSTSTVFDLTVRDVNKPPVVQSDKTVTVLEDAEKTALGIAVPTDADGDVLTVTVTGLPLPGIGSVRFADGAAVANGQTMSITDLTRLIYVPEKDQNGAGGDFSYTVSDGKGGTATQTVTITVAPVNDAPTTEANKTITVSEDGAAVALNIPAAQDVDGDALFLAITSIPTAGTIVTADGTAVANFTTLDASELTGLRYIPPTDASGAVGTFTYRVQDNKGGIAEQTITFIVEPVNDKPVVIAPDRTVAINQSIAVTELFSVTDEDGDEITAYTFSGGDPAAGRAFFTLGGAAQTGSFTVPRADLALVRVNTGAVGGTENLTVMAFDGFENSDPVTFALTNVGVNRPPTVSQTSDTVPFEGAIPVGLLFAASDPDGALTSAAFLELVDTSPGGGRFTVDGEPWPEGMPLTVRIGDLGRVAFVGASRNGAVDTIRVRANDGDLFGAWQEFTIATRSANNAPTVVVTDRTIAPVGVQSGVDLFAYADADNDPLSRIEIEDLNPGTGAFLTLNGVVVTIADITAPQLSQLRLHGATGDATDQFRIRVSDGTEFGAAETFTVTTRGTNAPPTVAPSGATTVTFGETVAASTLFAVADADGDPILRIEVRDLTNDGAPDRSGFFSFDGVRLPVGQVLSINALDLDRLTFTAAPQNGLTDTLEFRVFDGTAFGDWQSIAVLTEGPNRAPTVETSDFLRRAGQSVRLLDLIRASDPDGDPIATYTIRYDGGLAGSAYLSLTGATGPGAHVVPAGTAITLTAAQAARAVIYAIGTTGETVFDVTVSDGTAASDPSRFKIVTSATPDRLPGVEVDDAFVTIGGIVTMDTLVTVRDPDGERVDRVAFRDGTAAAESGYFTVNGVVQAAGVWFEVAAADLGAVAFHAGVVDRGADSVQVRASNAGGTGAVESFLIVSTEPGNRAPTVSTTVADVPAARAVPFSSLAAAVDPDGDTITRWRITDRTLAADSGYITLAGARYSQGSTVVMTAAQFRQSWFVSGAPGTVDDIAIEAFDGVTWSPISFTQVSAIQPNRAPVVSVRDSAVLVAFANDGVTVTTSSRLLSAMFDLVDPDGDRITRYQFFDSTVSPLSGSFSVNGAVAAPAQVIDVLAEQLPVTTFTAARTAAGGINFGAQDLVWVRAFDGEFWSEWKSFTVTTRGPTRPPEVTVSQDVLQVRLDQYVQLSTLLSYSDPDGDTISILRVWDEDPSADSAQIWVAGKLVKQGEFVDVLAKDFASIWIKGGTTNGVQTITVQAYDGAVFGQGASVTVRSRDSNAKPVVTATDASIGLNEGALPIFPLVTVTDADADEIERYQIADLSAGANSGFITINGVRLAANTTATVEAEDFLDPLGVAFIAGSVDRARDTIAVRAFDGLEWSAWTEFTISTFSANQAPVASATDGFVGLDAGKPLSSFVSVTDPNGDAIRSYRIYPDGGDHGGIRLLVDGAVQPLDTIVELTPAEFAKTTVQGGATPGSERFYVQGFDGGQWSAVASFTVTSRVSNTAPILTATDHSLGRNAAVFLSTLLSASDPDGDSIQRYEIVDQNAGARSGYLTVGGEQQASGAVVSLMAAQLADARFIGGADTGSDTLMARAFDGEEFSAWKTFSITTLA